MPSRTRILEGPRIVASATAALAVMTAVLLGIDGGGEAGIRTMIRATARTSVLLFVAAFTASSALALWPHPLSKWMVRNRRYLGLSFAVSHLEHLLFIIYAAAVAGFLQVNTVALVGGGSAYVFIAAMAATSFDGAVRWLGRPRWQRLHTIGAYYIWFIFLQTYLPRAVMESVAYAPLALLLIGALAVRLIARRRGAGREATTANAAAM
jgi:sulfoxide reductase heme-binding subunit YedZ